MKLSQLVVFVGWLAIGHADLASSPLTLNSIAPVAVVSTASFVDGVPANEMTEWEAYKSHFKKVYGGLEDRFRHNIYFANKEKKAKYEELNRLGLPANRLELDVFADFTCDELKVPDDYELEWKNFKLAYGKSYDEYEDRFRKTIYFIVKDIVTAHNRLFEHGLVPNQLQLNWAADRFFDETTSLQSLPSVANPNPWRENPLSSQTNQFRILTLDRSSFQPNNLPPLPPSPPSPLLLPLPLPPPMPLSPPLPPLPASPPVPYSLANAFNAPRVVTFVPQDRSSFSYPTAPLNAYPDPNANLYPNTYPNTYPNSYPNQYPSQYPNQYPSQYPNQYPSQYPNGYPNNVVLLPPQYLQQPYQPPQQFSPPQPYPPVQTLPIASETSFVPPAGQQLRTVSFFA